MSHMMMSLRGFIISIRQSETRQGSFAEGKAKCQAAKKVEDEALKILAKQRKNPPKEMRENDIRMLLLYYGVEKRRTMGILLVRQEQSTRS